MIALVGAGKLIPAERDNFKPVMSPDFQANGFTPVGEYILEEQAVLITAMKCFMGVDLFKSHPFAAVTV